MFGGSGWAPRSTIGAQVHDRRPGPGIGAGWKGGGGNGAGAGALATRGAAPLVAKKPLNDKALSRSDMKEIQRLLGQKGFDAGPADGIAGSKTRNAIKAYQRKAGLPPDGFADAGLLVHLQGKGG